MPVCKKCGSDHFNFQACSTKTSSRPVDIRYRKDEPEGFKVSKRWGNNSSVPIIYQMPARSRTGSLTMQDGVPYTPEPLPPDAA